MKWLKNNVSAVLTVLIFAVGALAGVRMELKGEIAKKADCGSVTRELDQLHGQLERIEALLIEALTRPADNSQNYNPSK
jgi:hypothetical protein